MKNEHNFYCIVNFTIESFTFFERTIHSQLKILIDTEFFLLYIVEQKIKNNCFMY